MPGLVRGNLRRVPLYILQVQAMRFLPTTSTAATTATIAAVSTWAAAVSTTASHATAATTHSLPFVALHVVLIPFATATSATCLVATIRLGDCMAQVP